MPRIAKVVDVPAIGELDHRRASATSWRRPCASHPSGRSESGRSAALDATAISGAASGTRHGIGSLRSANGGRLSRAAARLRHPGRSLSGAAPHAARQRAGELGGSGAAFTGAASGALRRPARALPPVPFTVSVPIGDTAPDDVWRRLGNRVRARGPGAPSGYGDPLGALPLREAICDYVRRSAR